MLRGLVSVHRPGGVGQVPHPALWVASPPQLVTQQAGSGEEDGDEISSLARSLPGQSRPPSPKGRNVPALGEWPCSKYADHCCFKLHQTFRMTTVSVLLLAQHCTSVPPISRG
jgi:hypothetical protein